MPLTTGYWHVIYKSKLHFKKIDGKYASSGWGQYATVTNVHPLDWYIAMRSVAKNNQESSSNYHWIKLVFYSPIDKDLYERAKDVVD